MINFIKKNIFVLLIIVVYLITLLSLISYGIPNPDRPFNYHMDEWHQLQAVRSLFTKGSNNVEGAANGTIFHFFLTGVYLVPFYLFKIVDIDAIKSSVTNLDVQFELFKILRLNTIIFGVLSISLFAYLAKRYFKVNSFVASFLFVFNPIWLSLSNFFKYDIALMFWILLAFLFLFRYIQRPTIKNYLLAGIFSSLTLAVKLETFNILITYILSFFLFTPDFRTKFRYLWWGLISFVLIFIFLGIPDILLGKGSLQEYLDSNLRRTPSDLMNNYKYGTNYFFYMISHLNPVTFGRVFYFSFLMACIVWIAKQIRKHGFNLSNIIHENRYLSILIIFGVLYLISLLPIRLEARGNRLVPLIPFMAIFVVFVFQNLFKDIKDKAQRIILVCFIAVFLFIQLIETYSWISIRTKQNILITSSVWITKNVKPGTEIGIENIPIYQFLPDIVVKEFYLEIYGFEENNRYKYKVISNKSESMANTIVITNDQLERNYFIKSEKNVLVKKLEKENYKAIKRFNSNNNYFSFFGDDLVHFLSILNPFPTDISIYQKI